MNRHGAFTLAELLVLVGLSGILGALLLPSLATDKRIALRAACAQNERQLALAWQMFATDHNGKVSIGTPNGGGGWLWDMDTTTRDNLVNQYNVPRKVFYCPSYPGKNLDVFWTCSACGGSSVGYWLLGQRVDANGNPITGTSGWAAGPNNTTFKKYANSGEGSRYVFFYDLSHSADPNRPLQVLLTDAIISEPTTGSFTNVPSTVVGSYQSPHLGTNGVPEGSNICYTDGHVEWRDMSAIKIRYTAGGGVDPGKLFWW